MVVRDNGLGKLAKLCAYANFASDHWNSTQTPITITLADGRRSIFDLENETRTISA